MKSGHIKQMNFQNSSNEIETKRKLMAEQEVLSGEGTDLVLI
jgi:hypothetical protein